jgi:hypothetical protein
MVGVFAAVLEPFCMYRYTYLGQNYISVILLWMWHVWDMHIDCVQESVQVAYDPALFRRSCTIWR